jgi:hypothetical protein
MVDCKLRKLNEVGGALGGLEFGRLKNIILRNLTTQDETLKKRQPDAWDADLVEKRNDEPSFNARLRKRGLDIPSTPPSVIRDAPKKGEKWTRAIPVREAGNGVTLCKMTWTAKKDLKHLPSYNAIFIFMVVNRTKLSRYQLLNVVFPPASDNPTLAYNGKAELVCLPSYDAVKQAVVVWFSC